MEERGRGSRALSGCWLLMSREPRAASAFAGLALGFVLSPFQGLGTWLRSGIGIPRTVGGIGHGWDDGRGEVEEGIGTDGTRMEHRWHRSDDGWKSRVDAAFLRGIGAGLTMLG